MRVITTVAAMQRLSVAWKAAKVSVGLVPTMGYLHEGHISLVKRARALVRAKGRVVVSIYVNPTQFAPTEDLAKYPRNLFRDVELCREAGVDFLFVPSDKEMYPKGYSTYVNEERLSKTMEGAARPTHFRGVTTIVAKLFNIVSPNVAIFGAKDFQQAAIVQRMTVDLEFPIKIVVESTVREVNGLAMSSRNKYLSRQQRAQAVILYRSILYARRAVSKIQVPATQLREEICRLIASASEARLDYVEFFDPQTLEPVPIVKHGTHMALAVFFGKTRLIDNTWL